MKPRLSTTVMAVPSRSDDVWRLQKKIGTSTSISWDKDYNGCWWNAKRAWKMVKGGATHHLVIQDDMTVCKDFIPSVERAVEVFPDSPVGLFANRKGVEEARELNKSWIKCRYFLWGCAFVLPVYLISQWLQWSEENIREDFVHDDFRIAMFCETYKIDMFCTVPSLAEHLGDGRSLLGHKTPIPRLARWYIGDDVSGLNIDWTLGADDPPVVNFGSQNHRYKKWFI